MSEHQEQVTVFAILELNERKYPYLKWIYAVPNGGLRHPAVAGRLKAEGVKSGVYDICIPIPRNGFHGAYIEMKFGKNKLTSEQLEFGTFIKEQNYYRETCWSADEALTGIEFYLGIELRK